MDEELIQLFCSCPILISKLELAKSTQIVVNRSAVYEMSIMCQLELPSLLIQKNEKNAAKRSRSHPVFLPIQIDSDNETDNGLAIASHISRMSAYALFSGLRTSETTSSTNDHNARSSVYSTSSSMTLLVQCPLIMGSLAGSQCIVFVLDACLLLVEAIWNHVTILSKELPFAIGDIISVLYCSHMKNFSTILASNPSTSDALSFNYFPQSMRFLRAKIIQELIQTERDYVNLLQNIVQGFTKQCRRRSDLFSAAHIQRLFGNIESIYILHCKFLRELELAFNRNIPESSAFGAIFLRNACRLLQGMPKLPLEGFLLTPVQRICRYRLQLSESLKATPSSHIDREPIETAVSAMENVAAIINEKKRRLEGLQQIALWQMNVDGWRGPDLVKTNNRMIHNGEIYCRCVIRGNIVWHKDVFSKIIWVEHLQQPLIYSPATPEERRMIRETIYGTSSLRRQISNCSVQSSPTSRQQ
ncbi:Spermatogenesis-associated protein 13 [Dirofilaria immitis]|nr:Spermatogenesis-associated protein 13 [Dirofilaria immitis]